MTKRAHLFEQKGARACRFRVGNVVPKEPAATRALARRRPTCNATNRSASSVFARVAVRFLGVPDGA